MGRGCKNSAPIVENTAIVILFLVQNLHHITYGIHFFLTSTMFCFGAIARLKRCILDHGPGEWPFGSI